VRLRRAATTNGLWTVQCEIEITLDGYVYDPNAGNGFSLDVVDELVPNGVQIPLHSLMPLDTPDYGCCWGPTTGTPAGYNTARMDARKLMAHGGSYTLPYTATFAGPAGTPIGGSPTLNCVSASLPGFNNLRAPAGPLGNERVCVPIEFPLSATTGGLDVLTDPVFDPATPDVGGAVVTGPPLEATGSVGTIITTPAMPSITKTCDPLVFALGEDTAPAQCTITIVVPAGLNISPTFFTDTFSFVGQAAMPNDNLVNGPLTNFSGAANLVCATLTSNPYNGQYARCHGPAFDALSNGGTLALQWNGQVRRPRAGEGPFRNCAICRFTARACADTRTRTQPPTQNAQATDL